MAVVVGVLMMGAAPAVSEAAPFSYRIDISGVGISGSGSVLFPTEDVGLPAVQLDLKATLFGNAVTFTADDIQSITWTGAGTDPDQLVVSITLTLGAIVGDPFLFLEDDNGDRMGSATCASTLMACGGADFDFADPVTWTYTPQDAPVPVPEPSTTVTVLAGLGYIMRQRFMRKVRS